MEEPSVTTKNRFYELKDLHNLGNILNRTDPIKIFVCNHCGQWNKIHQSDILDLDDMEKRKKQKADIHIETTPEMKIMFDKFKANFGGNAKALFVLMDDFWKHNQ